MSPEMVGILGLVIFLVLLILKLPVAVNMAVVGFGGCAYLLSTQTALKVVSADFYSTFANYNLATIALFVLMGFLVTYSGMSNKVFAFAYLILGRLRGGLAMASVVACAIFGAICGSYAATSAIVGSAAIPEMRRYKYSDSLATATIAAGGVIGTLIPPSVTFIIYAISAEQSVNRLFISGIVPGIMFMLSFIVVIAIITKRNPAAGPASDAAKPTFKEILVAAKEGIIQIVIVFVVSLGGLFAGYFTPTEAGGVGAAMVLIIALLSRQMTWGKFISSLRDTTKTTAMIMFLVAGATVFGRFIALSRMPSMIGDALTGINAAPIVIVLLVFLIYLILGMFMDTIPMVLLTVPIFYPIVVLELGYDPIWFGVIVVMCTCIGAFTPPVGANTFMVKALVKDVPLETIFKGSIPFLIGAVVSAILVIVIPQLATFLPDLILGAA
jgi:TRAP transporter, DctM subunit